MPKRRNPWIPQRTLLGYSPRLRRSYAVRVGIADIWNGILMIVTLGHYGSDASFAQTVRLVERHVAEMKKDATT